MVAHTQAPAAESADSDEKIDSLQLEFTYALTSQLQKQREYYEERLARLESKVDSESKQFQVKIDTIITDFTDLDIKYTTLKKEKTNVEKKLAQLNTKWVLNDDFFGNFEFFRKRSFLVVFKKNRGFFNFCRIFYNFPPMLTL